MTFEGNIARIEEIVGALEDDSIELDEALRLFEEGIARLREAGVVLGEAERAVQALVEEADGSFTITDLGG